MNIQRIRNITTGRPHTTISDIYTDIEYFTGMEGVMAHHLPDVVKALEPYLRTHISGERFWDGKYDITHTGNLDVPPMDADARAAFWRRYKHLPPLF